MLLKTILFNSSSKPSCNVLFFKCLLFAFWMHLLHHLEQFKFDSFQTKEGCWYAHLTTRTWLLQTANMDQHVEFSMKAWILQQLHRMKQTINSETWSIYFNAIYGCNHYYKLSVEQNSGICISFHRICI